VGGLVKLLGIERGTNTEGDTLTEEDVVGNGSDTTVVDLGLLQGKGELAFLRWRIKQRWEYSIP